MDQMGITAIIVADWPSIARAEAFLAAKPGPDTLRLGLVEHSPFRNWAGRLEWRRVAEYLPDDETAAVDNTAWTWAHQWYHWLDEVIPGGMLSFLGVPLGPLLERDVHRFLVPLLKGLSVARRFLDREGVGRLILFGGAASSALASGLRNVAEARGLVVEEAPEATSRPVSPRRLGQALAGARPWLISSAERLLAGLVGLLPTRFSRRREEVVRVLFQNHPLLQPVWEALAVLGKGQAFVVRHHLLGLLAGRPPRGGRFLFLPRCGRDERSKVVAFAGEWNELWPQVKAAASFWQRFVFAGWQVEELVRPYLQAILQERLPELASLVASFMVALQGERIDVVVLANDQDLPGRLLVSVARQLGIPSLVVDHGLTCDIQQPRGFLEVHADRMANWGEGNRQLMLRHGVAPERLVVTGAPMFEAELRAPRMPKAALCRRLGIDPRMQIVVYAGHPDDLGYTSRDWDQAELIARLDQAVQGIPDVRLVVRPHPSDRAMSFAHLLQERGSVAAVTREVNLYHLLANCDLLVTETSTVGLEAMLFDKPVLVVNLRGRPDLVPYVERGAALGVYDPCDLEPALVAALSDEATRERLRAGREAFLTYYLDRLDGHSAERVVELILQIDSEARSRRDRPCGRG